MCGWHGATYPVLARHGVGRVGTQLRAVCRGICRTEQRVDGMQRVRRGDLQQHAGCVYLYFLCPRVL